MLCAYLAAVVLAGLALNTAFGLWCTEPAAALYIAVLAVHQGYDTCRGDGCCAADPVSCPAASSKARDACQ